MSHKNDPTQDIVPHGCQREESKKRAARPIKTYVRKEKLNVC